MMSKRWQPSGEESMAVISAALTGGSDQSTPMVSGSGAHDGVRRQYETRATARSSSGVAVPKPKNSRYAGIISNSMSVPTW